MRETHRPFCKPSPKVTTPQHCVHALGKLQIQNLFSQRQIIICESNKPSSGLNVTQHNYNILILTKPRPRGPGSARPLLFPFAAVGTFF